MTPEPDPAMEKAIEQALRGGNPDDAARVVVEFRKCSLDEGRKEIAERLRKRAR